MTELSGYRIMWMVVMFDIPVMSKDQRHSATSFRKELLNQGFIMAQYSVYMRACSDSSVADRISFHLSESVPQDGKVDILMLTDKQYQNIKSFLGKKTIGRYDPPDQLTLF